MVGLESCWGLPGSFSESAWWAMGRVGRVQSFVFVRDFEGESSRYASVVFPFKSRGCGIIVMWILMSIILDQPSSVYIPERFIT